MSALYVWFIEPWTLGAWMWRACAAAALAAVPCAVLGVFLVLRRQSMIADALTHVALPGIVAAFLLTGSLSPLPMLLGATSSGVLATALMDRLGRSPHVRADAAIGIVFTAMFAAGVVALTMFVRHAHLDTRCALFGDVLGISDESLLLLSIVCPVVLMGVVAGWRGLALVSFDEGFARHVGAPVVVVHYALMVATSMTAVASFEAIGAILALAMFITPASTARLLTDRLTSTVAVAVGHGLLSALLGMYASVWFEVSSSGAIVTCSGLLYAAAFVFAPRSFAKLAEAIKSQEAHLAQVIAQRDPIVAQGAQAQRPQVRPAALWLTLKRRQRGDASVIDAQDQARAQVYAHVLDAALVAPDRLKLPCAQVHAHQRLILRAPGVRLGQRDGPERS